MRLSDVKQRETCWGIYIIIVMIGIARIAHYLVHFGSWLRIARIAI